MITATISNASVVVANVFTQRLRPLRQQEERPPERIRTIGIDAQPLSDHTYGHSVVPAAGGETPRVAQAIAAIRQLEHLGVSGCDADALAPVEIEAIRSLFIAIRQDEDYDPPVSPVADALESAESRLAVVPEYARLIQRTSELLGVDEANAMTFIAEQVGWRQKVQALTVRLAVVEQENARLKVICLAGAEPGVWPCGCRVRILDSYGTSELLTDEANAECDHHESMRVRAEQAEADVQALRTRVAQLEKELEETKDQG